MAKSLAYLCPVLVVVREHRDQRTNAALIGHRDHNGDTIDSDLFTTAETASD
jgi:hypothetical protein